MKNKLYLIGTISMVLTGLWSCQREPKIDNPNYNPETETVTTQLVLNISTKPTTKQSASETQASSSSSFLGIRNAYLMSIVEANKPGVILAADMDAASVEDISDAIGSGDVVATGDNQKSHRVMQLPIPLKTNKLLFYGRGARGPKTEDFGGIQNVTLDDCYGLLENYSISSQKGSADFRLAPRLKTGTVRTQFYAEEKLLSGIFTAIMNTSLSSFTIDDQDSPTKDVSQEEEGNMPSYGYDVTYSEIDAADHAITWADYADEAKKSPYHWYVLHETSNATNYTALEKKLGDLYTQMTNIKTAQGELRAASGEAIIRIVQDLWSVINSIRYAQPNDASEALAKYFAEQVYIHIGEYFAASSKGLKGSAMSGVSFLQTADIVNTIKTDPSYQAVANGMPEEYKLLDADYTALGQKLNDAKINLLEFPYVFNLPRGGTHMAFQEPVTTPTVNPGNYFYYPTGFNTSDMGGDPEAGGKYNAESYYFPAELLYFGNSPIRTSESDHTADDYPDGAANWINDSQWTADWSDNKVSSTTHSVAMKYNINYGVALLKTQVKFADNISFLYDNNKAVQIEFYGNDANEETDKQITIKDNMFKLTGIIIGGQSTHVGWDYLPVVNPETAVYDDNHALVTAAKKTDGFIFDKAIHAASQTWAANSISLPNYTVVFDNFRGTLNETTGIYEPADKQDIVNIALEFQNCTGEDFYGNHNLIRADGFFYLIGQLNPNAKITVGNEEQDNPYASSTEPNFVRSDYVVPPYTAEGGSQGVKRVFIQDYTTSVTFVIGQKSLQSAYLTVPNLKAASMSVGMSVDMKWEDGLTFEVPLGKQ